MTQEDKELLLKDLSARVPYGVMVEQTLFPPPLADKEQRLKSVQANGVVQLYWYKYIDEFVPIHCIKPYLRPMSSMTEDERNEWASGIAKLTLDIFKKKVSNEMDIPDASDSAFSIDWLNAHHFDYRGLIEKGLALVAHEGMYNLNNE